MVSENIRLHGSHGLASSVELVRARHFNANPETLASNAFQSAHTEEDAALHALAEQRALAEALESVGVNVVWLDPPSASRSPDGLFPNNWFSTHVDGQLVLYPLEAPSRRTERLPDLAARLRAQGFHVGEELDLSGHERESRFLEGTGSLVLDRANGIAYACRSTRTDPGLARRWAEHFGYRVCEFTALDPYGRAIYHTNVIMALGAGLAIVCLEVVPGLEDRERILRTLHESGQEILEINWQQVRAFAGNQLFLAGTGGPVVALSTSADAVLSVPQKAVIDRHGRRVPVDIATIERLGGGGVRCMLAEIFLPRAGGQ